MRALSYCFCQTFADTAHCKHKCGKLIDEHTGEEAADAKYRDRKDNEGDADGDAGEVVYQYLRGFAKPVQDRKESRI